MKNYFEELENKIKNNVQLEKLEIIDNSHKHQKHKSFSKEKFHLKLKIKSKYLNSLSRINAQKIVMKVLEPDLKNRIHALEINIEK